MISNTNHATDEQTPPGLPKELEALMMAWIAALADRFRNPLAGLQASMAIVHNRMETISEELALDGSEKMMVCMDAIGRSRRNLQLLDDLFADLQAYTQPLEFEPAAQSAAFLLDKGMQELGKGVHKKCLTSVRLTRSTAAVFCDQKLFVYAFKALLQNAIEAVPFTRDIEIDVSLFQGHDSQGRVGTFLLIADNGIGFASDYIEKAMEPFYSGKDASSGMGLAMCRRIADAHHGVLAINARECGGSCVSLFFPASNTLHRSN